MKNLLLVKKTSISLAVALSIGLPSVAMSQNSPLESEVTIEQFFNDSGVVSPAEAKFKFNRLAEEVGFHQALKNIGFAVKPGVEALVETAKIRGVVDSTLNPEKENLLDVYGDVVDQLANMEQATFLEMSDFLAENDIKVEVRESLVGDDGRSIEAVAFAKPDTNLADIIIDKKSATDTDSARALLMMEVGELAAQRVFEENNGDFGDTLLAVFYGHYSDLDSVYKSVLATNDDVEVDGRSGQTSAASVARILNDMNVLLGNLADDISSITRTAFNDDNSSIAIDNFIDFTESNTRILYTIVDRLARLKRFYDFFDKNFQELREESGETGELPNFRQPGVFLGVRHAAFHNVTRGLINIRQNIEDLTPPLVRSFVGMGLQVVKNIGKEQTNLWREARAAKLQKQLMIATSIGNVLAIVGSGGVAAVNSVGVAGTIASQAVTAGQLAEGVSNIFAGLGTAQSLASTELFNLVTGLGWVGPGQSSENISLREVEQIQAQRLTGVRNSVEKIYGNFPGTNARGGKLITQRFNMLSKAIQRSSVTVLQMQLLSGMPDRVDGRRSGGRLIPNNDFQVFQDTMQELGIRINITGIKGGSNGPASFTFDGRTADFGRNDRHNGCVGFFGKGLMDIPNDNRISGSNRGKSRVDDFLHTRDKTIAIIRGDAGACNANNQSLQQATEASSGNNR